MGAEQDIRLERLWINFETGREKYIKDLTNEELIDAVKILIKAAVVKEFHDRKSPGPYKHSWQTYVSRKYWDCCQTAWKRKLDIQKLIDKQADEEYAAVASSPPKPPDILKKPKPTGFELTDDGNTEPMGELAIESPEIFDYDGPH